MEWLTNLEPSVDAISLTIAILAGVAGTAVLIVLRARHPFPFSAARVRAFLKSLASAPQASLTASAPSGEELLGEAPAKPAAPEGNSSAPGPAAASDLACPPELSLRIDRIEAKVKARSARRSG